MFRTSYKTCIIVLTDGNTKVGLFYVNSSLFQVGIFRFRMTSYFVHFLFLWSLSVMASAEPAGCKIRITDRGLDMCEYMSHYDPKTII